MVSLYFLCEKLSVGGSFWFRDGRLCSLPLSALGSHPAWTRTSPVHVASISVSSSMIVLVDLEVLIFLVFSTPSGSYNLSDSSSVEFPEL